MQALATPDWGHDSFTDAMWASKFEPDALSYAMQSLFVRVSTMREDTKEATDFVSSHASYKWGSRIRRDDESTRGRRDITIRTKRPSGAKTEIDKLNYLDLYLYAWVKDGYLDTFVVFSVPALIRSGLLDRARRIWNKDGSSEWCFVPIEKLQDAPGCLLAGKKQLQMSVTLRMLTSREWLERNREVKIAT